MYVNSDKLSESCEIFLLVKRNEPMEYTKHERAKFFIMQKKTIDKILISEHVFINNGKGKVDLTKLEMSLSSIYFLT